MIFNRDKHNCQKKSSHVGFGTTQSGFLLVFDSIKSCTLMSVKFLKLNLVLQGIQTDLDLSEASFFGDVCSVEQQPL